MQSIDTSFILLILSTLLLIVLARYTLKKKPITKLQKYFSFMVLSVIIICVGLVVQKICFLLFSTNPIYFEGFVYIGTCLFPVLFFLMSACFVKNGFEFKKRYLLLFIVPILNIISVFTTNTHHLFYDVYSFNLNEMVYGPIMYVHLAYTYIMFFTGIVMLIKHTSKNSGFFSKQSLLIITGVSIPVIINILGSFNFIQMNVYTTPISFSLAVLFVTFAIFRFNFLSITPIALEKVVNRMSDCYLVLNDKNVIIDFNRPFLDIFKVKDTDLRNHPVSDLNKNGEFPRIESAIQTVSVSSKTVSYDIYYKHVKKYFHVEFSSIVDKNIFLGILILFKDTTQHEEDMKTIKDNQDMLVERERFASLGQMIGGIAHNLKTPIMSIAGAAEALTDLITEYDISIGDPEVTSEDHHAIAEDMRSWVEKVKTHTAYMSDVITAVKGQAVSSNDSVDTFTIDELVKRVTILMKHELKHSLVDLNCNISIDKDFTLRGSINSLVQVIDNIISNAIQSYNGQPDSIIDFNVDIKDNTLVLSVRDYGCGMSEDVQNKLFNEMITTKGKNGTGLGLFMSYSNIKAKFNGNITFESEVRKRYDFSHITPFVLKIVLICCIIMEQSLYFALCFIGGRLLC